MNKYAAMVAVVAVGVIASTGTAIAVTTAAPKPITGCVAIKDGALRVLKAGESCNSKKESALAWNIQGPAGLDGTDGEAGPTGPAGAPGISGKQIWTVDSQDRWMGLGEPFGHMVGRSKTVLPAGAVVTYNTSQSIVHDWGGCSSFSVRPTSHAVPVLSNDAGGSWSVWPPVSVPVVYPLPEEGHLQWNADGCPDNAPFKATVVFDVSYEFS